MNSTNKKLIIWIAVVIVLLINTGILWLIFSFNNYWQDIVCASLAGLIGITLFYPLINVARKKITFDEYLKIKKDQIPFFCYLFFVFTVVTVMYFTMNKVSQLKNTIGVCSVIFVFIATMLWIRFTNGENVKDNK